MMLQNKDGGPADTRNKKNGKKQSSEDDPKKEKRMNMKRRLDNGMVIYVDAFTNFAWDLLSV